MNRYIPSLAASRLVRHLGLGLIAGLLLMCNALAQPTAGGAQDAFYQQSCTTSQCHPVAIGGGMPPHLPYFGENCLVCHESHTNETQAPLKAGGDQLCLDCHDQVQTNAQTHLKHPPEAGSCLECHDPHQSRTRNLLRGDELLTTCADCHQEALEQGRQMPYRHDYFDPKTQCGTCHFAHQGSENYYLRPDVSQACLTCHDLPIKMKERTIANIQKQLDTAQFHHGSDEQIGCPICHTPHGSVQPSLLNEGYPAGSYSSYDAENYALCWQCHDSGLVEQARTRTATAFRDDTNNLHFVHVSQLGRGRSCHLCHEPHAADRPHLLRQSIQFKQWSAPLNWEPTEQGATCTTPCHREMAYAR